MGFELVGDLFGIEVDDVGDVIHDDGIYILDKSGCTCEENSSPMYSPSATLMVPNWSSIMKSNDIITTLLGFITPNSCYSNNITIYKKS